MVCEDALVGNDQHENSRYCLAIPGEVYVVYLPNGGMTDLDLSNVKETKLTVMWFNPLTVAAPAIAHQAEPPRAGRRPALT